MISALKKITDSKLLVIIQLSLIALALFCLSFKLNEYPLVDYDEATYAKVTMDTMRGGDILSLKYNNVPWFEKPPIYFWMSMASIKIFGQEDFAFRIPSIIFAILSLWLTYLIAYKTTKNISAAVAAFLILLSSGIFYLYCREARLDSGVVFSILAALYLIILGWEKEKCLFWVFPAIATGFMIKSVIALLAFPIIIIYAFFYQHWRWIKNKYLWWGLTLSSLIIIPWHLLQTWRFGSGFWNSYIGYHVYQRVISKITGSSDPFYYLDALYRYNSPWTWVAIILLILILVLKNKRGSTPEINKKIWAPLFSFIFLIALFSVFKTRLLSYILPAFPFLALFISEAFAIIFNYFKISKKLINITLILLVLLGGLFCKILMDFRFPTMYFEEKEMGLILKQSNIYHDPFYLLDFPFVESLTYYGNTEVKLINTHGQKEQILKAPFYLAIPTFDVGLFLNEQGIPSKEIAETKILYKKNYYYLIYSGHNLTIPVM